MSHFKKYKNIAAAAFVFANFVISQRTFSQAINYKQEDVVLTPGVTSDAQLNSLGIGSVLTTRTYLDGLGRSIQSVALQASPNSNQDIVQVESYSTTGQQLTNYLPYVDKTGNYAAGSYRATGIVDQGAYFNSNSGATNQVAADANPYDQKVFENSPLRRLLEMGDVGSGFQPGQHYKSYSYRSNSTADAVQMWGTDGSYKGQYAANSLSVMSIVKADGVATTLTFTDISGQLILKRQVLSSAKNLDTYYIYNSAGSLAYVVPPRAVALMQNSVPVNYSITQTGVLNLIYSYLYDSQNRIFQKNIPGSAPIYMIYDPLNRPVLVQNGNLRTNNQWYYIKYDIKGRAISHGVYTDGNSGHTGGVGGGMQSYVTGLLSYKTASNCYETRTGSTASYYTNNSFPKVNYDGTPLQDLMYGYYDDYSLTRNIDPTTLLPISDFPYNYEHLLGEASTNAATSLTRGMLTMIRKRTVGQGLADIWLVNVILYDRNGHTIQLQSNNHLGSSSGGISVTDYKTNVVDFTGKPTVNLVTKSAGAAGTTLVKTTLTYDSHNVRLQYVDQVYNTQASVRIASYQYNEVGQLIRKNLEPSTSTSAALQHVDYRYNIRGQITSLNNSTLTNDNGVTNNETTDLFGMEIMYDKPDPALTSATIIATPSYTTKVSAVKWMTVNSSSGRTNERSYVYSYDNVGRLTAANYAERAAGVEGSTTKFGSNLNGFDESGINYDENGNIVNLNRNSSVINTSNVTTLDQLTYSYNPLNPNQLSNVSNIHNNANSGFLNITGTNGGTPYQYDSSGNLISDPYKGLQLAYNILNSTKSISIVTGPGGAVVTGSNTYYTYDATGTVIRKQQNVITNGTNKLTTTDYVDGFVYINSSLSSFQMGEGRVVNLASILTPQYIITDPQGNARFSFEDNGSGAIKVIQENSYYPFGLTYSTSTVNIPTVPNINNKLFNGGSEWENDYSNLPDYYQTPARNYNPELGQFISIDPMAEVSFSRSPYHYAKNNPVLYNDPSGDDPGDGSGGDGPDPGGAGPGDNPPALPDQTVGPDNAPGSADNPQTYDGYNSSAESKASSAAGTNAGGNINGDAGSGSDVHYDYAVNAQGYTVMVTPIAGAGPNTTTNVYDTTPNASYALYTNDPGGLGVQDSNAEPSSASGAYANDGGINSASQGGNSNSTGSEGFDYEKLESAIVTGTDSYGVALTKANVINTVLTGSKIEGKAFKYLTGSGTVVGAIAGGIPAAISIYNNGLNWRNGTAAGLAVLGVVSEFTGLGEAWDGTVGLGIAAGSLGFDIWDATHPAKK